MKNKLNDPDILNDSSLTFISISYKRFLQAKLYSYHYFRKIYDSIDSYYISLLSLKKTSKSPIESFINNSHEFSASPKIVIKFKYFQRAKQNIKLFLKKTVNQKKKKNIYCIETLIVNSYKILNQKGIQQITKIFLHNNDYAQYLESLLAQSEQTSMLQYIIIQGLNCDDNLKKIIIDRHRFFTKQFDESFVKKYLIKKKNNYE